MAMAGIGVVKGLVLGIIINSKVSSLHAINYQPLVQGIPENFKIYLLMVLYKISIRKNKISNTDRIRNNA